MLWGSGRGEETALERTPYDRTALLTKAYVAGSQHPHTEVTTVSVYNTLLTSAACPRCGVESDIRADFRFGLQDLLEYRVGDSIVWKGRGVRTPSQRPANGDYLGEAFTICPNCHQEFWLLLTVRNDVIVRAEVDRDREEVLR
jgi:hypothetical protein